MVDYICQYLSNVRERRVTPDVQPGYMRAQLPDSAPMDPDSWDNIFGDIEKIIMPGVRNKKSLLTGVSSKTWECRSCAGCVFGCMLRLMTSMQALSGVLRKAV